MKRNSSLQILFALMTIFGLAAGAVSPEPVAASPSAQGQGDGVRYGYSQTTGKLTFVGAAPGRPIDVPGVSGVAALGLEAQAMGLVAQYASAFGLSHPARELQVKSQENSAERSTVKYQQVYQGIPVLGGELVVNTQGDGYLTSMNGEVSPDLSLDTSISVGAQEASSIALEFMKKWYPDTQVEFQTSEPEQWIYDPRLLEDKDGPVVLGWRMDVTATDIELPIRELVLVDAQSGNVPLHFNQIDAGWQGQRQDPAPTDTLTETLVPTETLMPTETALPTETPFAEETPVPDAGSVEPLVVTTWYVATTGNDSNSCSSPGSPCLTINGAIGKAANGDVVKVVTGTYTGSGTEVALINKSITLSGGWDVAFTTQSGMASIDGETARRAITINSNFVATIERFVIKNGGGDGDAIYNAGTLTLDKVHAYSNVRAIINANGSLTINSSAFTNNGGIQTCGGGIFNDRGTVAINNSTISGNSSSSIYCAPISGLANDFGTVALNNVTITNNLNGGIWSYPADSTTLQNSLIAGNKLTNGDSADCSSGDVLYSLGYNLIGSALCTLNSATGDQIGTSVSPIKPRLNSLQDNGGPTLTHALGIGSPAINAGSPASPGSGGDACLGTDQRGTARPVESRCDIGAYEGSVPWVPTPFVSTYTASGSSSLPGSLLCTQTQPNCTNGSNLHADAAHKYAIGTHNLYATKHNRDSIDNNGMVITSTVHYCDPNSACPYDNAYWSGAQMVYGDAHGFANADDVVAHELTHGVTERESGLFYYMESGAINESLSDIWGEYYDQTNGLGNDASTVKWKIGEDITGLGALRSMSNPPAYGDPDRMLSSLFYKGTDDLGGVHWNSGVNNKAAYLMVRGGSFNGKTVTGIGWGKTAAVYYEAQTHLLTTASDYLDLYNILYQSCLNLVGGANGITSANCTQVRNATAAVEMNKRPSGYRVQTGYCPAGNTKAPDLFYDGLESGSGNWAFTHQVGNSHWTRQDFYPIAGSYHLFGNDYDSSQGEEHQRSKSAAQLRSGIVLPSSGTYYLHFKHAFEFEKYQTYNFDGAVLEYSINGGSTWLDAKPLFNAGKGYGGTIFQYPSGYTSLGNPLGGRQGFVGASNGYVSSRYKLSSLVGTTVKFRWVVGTDYTGWANLGWSVDEVRVYKCVPVPSKPVLVSPANGAHLTSLTPHLDWSNSTPTPHHYQVQVSTSNNFSALVVNASPTGSAYQIPAALAGGTTHYWRVRAYNSAGGASAWSTSWSFRTP